MFKIGTCFTPGCENETVKSKMFCAECDPEPDELQKVTTVSHPIPSNKRCRVSEMEKGDVAYVSTHALFIARDRGYDQLWICGDHLAHYRRDVYHTVKVRRGIGDLWLNFEVEESTYAEWAISRDVPGPLPVTLFECEVKVF